MIQIGIVDTHEIMRKGLACLIDITGGMHVVCEACTVTDLLSQTDPAQLDVLVVEPHLAWGHILAVIQSIRNKNENLQILIFSDCTDTDRVQSSLRAGAKGFVSKRAKLTELIYGIQNLARRQPFLCQEVMAKLTVCLIDTFSKLPHELLSRRELQIFLLLVNGKTAAAAADELHLSAKTVSTHKARIMQKMNVDSFSKLVQYASVHGLISEEQHGSG